MTDKWGRRLFKAGAVALLIMGVVHSFSLFVKQVPANATEKQLLDLMDNYKFDLMGTRRSMSDLMRGFSVAFMLAALGFGVFDVALFGERSALLKRAALINIFWLGAMAAVSDHYFFVIPSSFLNVSLGIFLFAWWRLPSQASD